MANRFWVGGTGTWDAATTTNWSATSGGAGGQSVPGSSDDVTFDAASGTGTVTVSVGAASSTITLISLTASNFNGTLDFAGGNNNSLTLSGGSFNNSSSVTRTLNMGTGTFTLQGNTPFWNCSTGTNLTLAASTSTISFTGTGGTSARRFGGGGKTYATVSVVSGTAAFTPVGNSTIGTLTISPGNTVYVASGTTLTVTTLTNISGSSSAQTLFVNDGPLNGAATIALTNNVTCDWCGFSFITRSGAGVITATNSYDFKGNNTGASFTITAPSVGGGGVIGVIGG